MHSESAAPLEPKFEAELPHSPDSAYEKIMFDKEDLAETVQRQAKEIEALREQNAQLLLEKNGKDKIIASKDFIIADLERITRHDTKTGLLNSETWKLEIESRIQIGKPFSVRVFDLRFFKLVNDEFGHDMGDSLLRDFAELLKTNAHREDDVFIYPEGMNIEKDGASRLGGDEFGLTTSLEGGEKRTGSLDERVAAEKEYFDALIAEFVTDMPKEIRELGFNIAVGHVVWDPNHPIDIDTLLRTADEDMYKNKESQLAALDAEQLRKLIVIEELRSEAKIPKEFVGAGRYATAALLQALEFARIARASSE